jgi:hypothetical protein
MFFDGGGMYKGEWKYGKMNGKGVKYTADCICQRGEWKEGEFLKECGDNNTVAIVIIIICVVLGSFLLYKFNKK